MLEFSSSCCVSRVGRAWIPAFAGMTMKAKVAGMGGSSENRCKLLIKKWLMVHFHFLVVHAGLACLWIPVFAGITMKAKAAVMGGSLENPLHRRDGRPPRRTDGVGSIQGKLSPLETHPWPSALPSGGGKSFSSSCCGRCRWHCQPCNYPLVALGAGESTVLAWGTQINAAGRSAPADCQACLLSENGSAGSGGATMGSKQRRQRAS
jgi:hypothetical protein